MADTYLNLILRSSKTGTGAADAKRELQALAREQEAARRTGVQATQAYFNMSQSLKGNASIANVTQQSLARLNEHMKAGRITADQYAAASRASMLASGQVSQASLKAADEINKLNARYAAGRISAQQYAEGLRGIQRELQASQGFMERYGSQVRLLATVSLAALAVGFVEVSKSAAQFEKSMNQIVALTNTTQAELGGMTDAVLKMAGEVGKSPKELAEALYFIASSGHAGAKGLEVLEASAKASAAGLGETKVVADAVTSTLNAYKLGVEDSARVTDLLIKIVKEGKGEPTAFAGSLGRILPIASAAGVSFEEVGASMATMTRVGLSAEESATALRGTLGALVAPGKMATDALMSLGISTEDLRKSIRERGLLVTLQDLMTRTKGNVETLDLIIPNVRALTGVLATAGSQGEEYARILHDMKLQSGDTETAFRTAAETMAFKADQAAASFETLKITVGNMLLPALKDLMVTVKSVFDSFTALDPSTQKLIASFGVVALSAAPATAAINKVIGAAKSMGDQVKTFNEMRTAGDSMFKSLSALRGIEFGLLAAGLAIILATLARISEAAQKSSDDVIKMSQSADAIDRAAAAYELMAHGQDRLRAALDGTHKKIIEGQKEYADYRSAIDATAKAAGYEINAAGDLIQVYYNWQGRQEKVIEANYALMESTFNATKGIEGISDSMDEGARYAHGYWRSAEQVAEANKAIGESAEDAARNQENLARSVAVMTAGYGGAVSKEMRDFGEKQDDLKDKAAKLAAEIETLNAAQGRAVISGKKKSLTENEAKLVTLKLAEAQTQLNEATDPMKQAKLAVEVDKLSAKLDVGAGSVQTYVDNSKKIGELTTEYEEVNKAISENVLAHDEAMKRIVLDIAQQQLAVDGWTISEITAFTEVAKKMGVFDEASATLTASVLAATGQLAADGNAQLFADNLGAALSQANSSAQDTLGVVGEAAQSAADIIANTLSAKEIAALPPVEKAAYEESLRLAKKLALDTGIAISASMSETKIPPLDTRNFKASMIDVQIVTANTVSSISTTLPKTIAAVAGDPNVPLFSTLFNTSMTGVQKDVANTATAITTTLPPTIAALATDPNLPKFATLFNVTMNSVITATGLGVQANKDYQASIDALHGKDIIIKTTYKTEGEPVAGVGASSPKPPERQSGGAISVPSWVGEGGPELFFPASGGGYVMNNSESSRLVRALEALSSRAASINQSTHNQGGDTIVINDKMALAYYYEQRRRARIERSNLRMGS